MAPFFPDTVYSNRCFVLLVFLFITSEQCYARFCELGISRESRYILGIRKKSVVWTLKSRVIPWIRHLRITRRWPRNKLGITMATYFVDNFHEDIVVYWNLFHRLTRMQEGPNSLAWNKRKMTFKWHLIFHSSTDKAQNLPDDNSGTRPAIFDYRDQIFGQFYCIIVITILLI